MIKKHLKTLILTTVITLLPILAGLILWNRLPERMPFHWNAAGEVDGWAGRPVAVFVGPVLMAAIEWICVLVTGADPKQKDQSGKVMGLVLWLIPVLSVLVSFMMYSAAMGMEIRVEKIMPVFLGLLFVVIGNYLPKCKQSYTVGIKIPWTLNSEENWFRTHRMAGRLWTVCGLAMMVTAFLGGFWVFMVITLVMVLVPVLYSWVLYRRGI